MLDVYFKFISKPMRIPINEIEDAHEKMAGKEIKSFKLVFVKYLGKKFESRKLFVTQIENALVDYYQSVVQYLKNWEKPAPKIQNPEVKKLPE